jgi:hypothetical protein
MAAHVLVFIALAASVLLFFRAGSRLWPLVALIASGLEATLALGVLSLNVKGVPLPLILGGALAAGGLLTWLGSDEKLVTTAATVVTVIGAAQVLALVL